MDDGEKASKKLIEENKLLREENARLRRFPITVGTKFGALLLRALTAFGLGARIRDYIEQASPTNPFPKDETARLANAIINRWLVGTFLSILLALLPLIIIIFQVFLLWSQNNLISKQLDLQTQQSKIAVQPALNFHEGWSHDEKFFGLQVLNQGFGPAIINSIRIRVDTNTANTWKEVIALLEIENSPEWVTYFYANSPVILRSGDARNIFGVSNNDVDYTDERKDTIWNALKRISITIDYCSIYEECTVLSY